jgi:hypothetical protein
MNCTKSCEHVLFFPRIGKVKLLFAAEIERLENVPSDRGQAYGKESKFCAF